jgi:hypothetical protein
MSVSSSHYGRVMQNWTERVWTPVVMACCEYCPATLSIHGRPPQQDYNRESAEHKPEAVGISRPELKQASSSLLLTEAPGWAVGQSMQSVWNLRWTKWHWDGFSSSTFVSPASYQYACHQDLVQWAYLRSLYQGTQACLTKETKQPHH